MSARAPSDRRVLLDTHTWLWWRSEPTELSKAAIRAIERADVICLSSISIFELSAKIAARRLTLDLPLDEWIHEATNSPGFRVLDVTSEIAQKAGLLGETWSHGDPCDRIIVATAQVQRLPLATADQRIQQSGLVLTIW